MKERYHKPEAEVSEFATVDVVTTSGNNGGDEPITTPIDWGD